MCTRNESTLHCVIEFASYISEASMMSNEKGFHVKDAAVNCEDTVISSMTDHVTLSTLRSKSVFLIQNSKTLKIRSLGFI